LRMKTRAYKPIHANIHKSEKAAMFCRFAKML